MLYAENIETNYENFIAVCPECGFRNIFNRVSDLKTTQPISYKEVKCFDGNCRKIFAINGDRVDTKYQTILLDCYSLYKEKRYSTCILLITKALEVFFFHYLTVELAYRPFWKEQKDDINSLNKVLDHLRSTIEKLAYGKLKNVFLNWIVNESAVLCINDSISKIDKLKKYSNDSPEEHQLNAISNQELASFLIELKNCKIDKLRNKVAHKEAYRVSRAEVKHAIKEVRRLLFKISYHLNVTQEDISSYH